PVDVARSVDRIAAEIADGQAVEAEAVGAIERAELDGGGEPAGLAEHHVARSARRTVRIGIGCADDQVVEAVAIDVTGAADGPAAVIEPPLAVEAEAVGAVERTELDGGGKPAGLAEHHVARSRTGAVRVCI